MIYIRKGVSCCYCGGSLQGRSAHTVYCLPCSFAREKWKARSDHAVSRAKRTGELPNILGKLCVDCEAPAVEWDHRDYAKPLSVVPVCRSCNRRRGPAEFPRAPTEAAA